MSALYLSSLDIIYNDKVLVKGVSLALQPGRVVALVGASGSGKTLTARALLGLVDLRPGVVSAELAVDHGGRRHHPYAGLPSRRAVEAAFAPLRGGALGLLPQDARASLDPLQRVGAQVAEVLRLAGRPPDPLPWLARAGLDCPEDVAAQLPHTLSGGMAQRVAIALALARGSRLLIADEPSSGLDATVARALLRRLRALADEGCGLLFITHDLRLLPGFADEVLVMHAGRVVARGASLDGLAAPEARALVEATRRVSGGRL